jgi:hypothetical protein
MGEILIISDMYNEDVRLIITRKKLSFKKHFTCQIQELKKIKCKYIKNLNN